MSSSLSPKIGITTTGIQGGELLQSASLRLELPKLRSFGDGFIRLMSFPLLRVMPLHASTDWSYSLSTGVRTASRSPILYVQHGLVYVLQQGVTLLTSGHVLSPSSALSVVSVLPLLDLSVPRQLGGSATSRILPYLAGCYPSLPRYAEGRDFRRMSLNGIPYTKNATSCTSMLPILRWLFLGGTFA